MRDSGSLLMLTPIKSNCYALNSLIETVVANYVNFIISTWKKKLENFEF